MSLLSANKFFKILSMSKSQCFKKSRRGHQFRDTDTTKNVYKIWHHFWHAWICMNIDVAINGCSDDSPNECQSGRLVFIFFIKICFQVKKMLTFSISNVLHHSWWMFLNVRVLRWNYFYWIMFQSNFLIQLPTLLIVKNVRRSVFKY